MKVWEVRYNREVIVAFDNPDEANQKADYLSELFDDDGYKAIEVEKNRLSDRHTEPGRQNPGRKGHTVKRYPENCITNTWEVERWKR